MGFLVLEDGSIFEGTCFRALDKVVGEVVFTTGMTGYQETLTDPSYYGQIVVMTFPMVGNYGINKMDIESEIPRVRGFIVREACSKPNNWMSTQTLEEYLYKNKIVALQGIDTRALTRRIREKGTMNGLITPYPPADEDILQLKEYRLHKPVEHVMTKKVYTIPGEGHHIAVIDFGVKRSIIESLKTRGCQVTVFPANTKADQILGVNPDAVLLSNGPGDPKDNVQAVDTIKVLIECKPVLGICLGYQLLALTLGADTEKLKYGHRGCNHPVVDLTRGRTYITSQNHGYTVKSETIDSKKIEVTHINLNDGTIEGLKYKDRLILGIQFHPEACPGPADTNFIFDEFLDLIGN
ncbi:MAG TPA: carbamoyl phosphate synthase small subunit [Clostridia bacterium]|nr:carbamoyl phosphate synthase small subunit [Clostridia bacterium]